VSDIGASFAKGAVRQAAGGYCGTGRATLWTQSLTDHDVIQVLELDVFAGSPCLDGAGRDFIYYDKVNHG